MLLEGRKLRTRQGYFFLMEVYMNLCNNSFQLPQSKSETEKHVSVSVAY